MTERFEGVPEQKEQGITAFREEMEAMKQEDIQRGHAHLFEVDVNELNEEDYGMWEKVKNNSITREDIHKYHSNAFDENEMPKDSRSPSRRAFIEFIKNRANVVFLRNELAKRKKTDNQQ